MTIKERFNGHWKLIPVYIFLSGLLVSGLLWGGSTREKLQNHDTAIGALKRDTATHEVRDAVTGQVLSDIKESLKEIKTDLKELKERRR